MDINEAVVSKIGILLIFLFVVGLGIGEFTGFYDTLDVSDYRGAQTGITLDRHGDIYFGEEALTGTFASPFYIIAEQDEHCAGTKAYYTFYPNLYPTSHIYSSNEQAMYTNLLLGSTCQIQQKTLDSTGKVIATGSYHTVYPTVYNNINTYSAGQLYTGLPTPGKYTLLIEAICSPGMIFNTPVDSAIMTVVDCEEPEEPEEPEDIIIDDPKTYDELKVECERVVDKVCEDESMAIIKMEYINGECVERKTLESSDYCYAIAMYDMCNGLGKDYDEELDRCVTKISEVIDIATMESCGALGMSYDKETNTCVDVSIDPTIIDSTIIDPKTIVMMTCIKLDLKYDPITNTCITEIIDITEEDDGIIDITEEDDRIDNYALAFFVGISILFIAVTPSIVKKLKETRGL